MESYFKSLISDPDLRAAIPCPTSRACVMETLLHNFVLDGEISKTSVNHKSRNVRGLMVNVSLYRTLKYTRLAPHCNFSVPLAVWAHLSMYDVLGGRGL